MLGALNYIPPATPLIYLSWGLVGFIFNKLIRSRRRGWWLKYNYITSAALDSGLALSTIIIFFALLLPQINPPQWWGNTVIQGTMVSNPFPSLGKEKHPAFPRDVQRRIYGPLDVVSASFVILQKSIQVHALGNANMPLRIPKEQRCKRRSLMGRSSVRRVGRGSEWVVRRPMRLERVCSGEARVLLSMLGLDMTVGRVLDEGCRACDDDSFCFILLLSFDGLCDWLNDNDRSIPSLVHEQIASIRLK
jgi:hypothetical protein